MTVRTLSPAHTDSHVQPVVVDDTQSFETTATDDDVGDFEDYNVTPLLTEDVAE